MSSTDHSADNHYDAEDPLVQRLRTLSWPTVDDELRSRCWDDFQRMLADPDGVATEGLLRGGVPEATRRSVARRQDFTRRLPQRARESVGEPLAAYASVRYPWARPARSALSLTG